MKYMMFVCVEEDTELTPEESLEIGPATEACVAEMDGRGVRLQGNQLAPVTDATTPAADAVPSAQRHGIAATSVNRRAR